MQGRRNSSALAMELRLSCINPSVYAEMNVCYMDIGYKHWFLAVKSWYSNKKNSMIDEWMSISRD